MGVPGFFVVILFINDFYEKGKVAYESLNTSINLRWHTKSTTTGVGGGWGGGALIMSVLMIN